MKQLAAALVMIAASLGVTAGSGSAATPEKLFRVGMSQAEMHAAFGEPQSYLDVRAQRHLTRAEFLAVRGTCLCRPLYSRKTAQNEYEVLIFEETDDSASRLHPVVRINSVRFTLDRDMSPEEALADIAEAKALCAGQCALQPNKYGEKSYTRREIDVQFSLRFSEKSPNKVESVTMWSKK